MPGRRPMFARMAGQEARRPQLVRIAVLLGLVARQGHQPCLGLGRDRRLLARSRTIVQRHQGTIGQRSFDAALDGLMMASDPSCGRKKRSIFPIGEKHLRPLHPARRFSSRPRKSRSVCHPTTRPVLRSLMGGSPAESPAGGLTGRRSREAPPPPPATPHRPGLRRPAARSRGRPGRVTRQRPPGARAPPVAGSARTTSPAISSRTPRSSVGPVCTSTSSPISDAGGRSRSCRSIALPPGT